MTLKLANEALNAAFRLSNYTPESKNFHDVYGDAVEAEIKLIYAAMENCMAQEDHPRALETIKRLMSQGRRYSYRTALEQAA
ncbi:hypothetical protein [Marinomonas sp.]|uniref:hypothetical protein n=1 Tax=Marinomonas sp. TaxID=1904862 RepID=UPI003A91FF66